jgi:hypothetical protein
MSETAAGASSDVEISEGLLAMAHRNQAALIKKKQKAKPERKKARKEPALPRRKPRQNDALENRMTAFAIGVR